MAKILLAHSYFLRFDAKAHAQMQPYPPLGTLYAASVLRDAGHDIVFFDTMFAENEEAIEEQLLAHRPDYTIFYEDDFHFLSKMCLLRMREACFRMAEIARQSGSIVIAHGSDPVDHLPEYFAHGVFAVICGEGEQTVVDVVAAFEDGGTTSLAEVQGIAYPVVDGHKLTATRPMIRNLDTIPFPAWDLVDMHRYRDAWVGRHGYFSLNIVTTRGCPYSCNWCAKPVYGQIYHSRSPENVVDEMLHLQRRFSPDHIWFSDDILGLKPGWLAHFAECVESSGCRIPFSCQTRVDLVLRDDNARHIASAGAHTVWIGAESGSQAVLDAMDKGTTVDQIRSATRLLQSENVRVAWFLQFGYLGETLPDVRATQRLVRECGPDDIGISVSYPLPGTPFHARVASLLGTKQNWTESGDLDLMYPGTFRPAFYRALHTAVHKEFRIRQAFRALRTRDTSRAAQRRLALLPWNALELVAAKVRMLLHRIASGSPRLGGVTRA